MFLDILQNLPLNKSQHSLGKRWVYHPDSTPFLSSEAGLCWVIRDLKIQSGGLPHLTLKKWFSYFWENADGLNYASYVTGNSCCHNVFWELKLSNKCQHFFININRTLMQSNLKFLKNKAIKKDQFKGLKY